MIGNAADLARRFISLGSIVLITACGGGGDGGSTTAPPPPLAQAASVRLDRTAATIARGQPLTIVATPLDASGTPISGKTVAWSTSDGSIVIAAAGGKLAGGNAGSATVTASVDGQSASAPITVVAFASIEPGPANTCAITLSGRLYCAGSSYGGLAEPVGGSLRFTAVSSNGEPPASAVSHACAISIDADAYCWGSNAGGALGTGDTPDHSAPTLVAGGLKFAQITTGKVHTCGLATSGDAYCWGDNTYGQLGNGSLASSTQPVPISGNLKFVRLVSGRDHACGLTASGDAYCWGFNGGGNLGTGEVIGQRTTPGLVAGGHTFSTITTKTGAACGVTTSGDAFCWGDNTIKELGAATTETCGTGAKPCSHVPLAVTGGKTFTSIASSQYATCAITAQAQAYCWGGDMQHVFGAAVPPVGCDVSGFTFGCTLTPTAGPSGFTSIAGSARNFCGVKSDGIAYCWGGNDLGQLGYPGASDTSAPMPFSIDPASAP